MIQATPSLGFSEAINASTSKIFQFEGRSRRSEFWWTQLLVLLLSLVLTPLGGLLLDLLTIPLTFRRLHDTGRSGWWWGVGVLLKVFLVVVLIHDFIISILNVDGFYGCTPHAALTLILKYSLLVIGIVFYQIILFILCCIDSEQFENKYGKSPKYIDSSDGNF